jgi:uracil-DNA glycosylase family 4
MPSNVRTGVPSSLASLVRDVRACRLCTDMTHSHVLSLANGRIDAPVVFVAEAVGRRGGAVTGIPLTGDESGRRFSSFLALASIAREDVFVTNAVLCNPIDIAGRNRSPKTTEVARCRTFLERTLDLVRAPVVVALGRVALESLRRIEPHDASLPVDTPAAYRWRSRTLIALYHPSRQSILHRPQALQDDDWRWLGRVVGDLRRRR